MNDWHEEYRALYARLKKEGVPFFPDVVFKDMVMMVLIFSALCVLAWQAGAGLEELADPTDATYNPRPEWYFMFLFQALKFFPGSMEAVAAVVLPGATVVFLVLLPFLDRSRARHPLDRPLLTAAGVLALMTLGWLTYEGLRSPLTNPAVAQDPQVRDGLRLFRDLRCGYCHAVNGEGGRVGPDLAKVEGDRAAEWVSKHVRNPQAATPASPMPKLDLLEDEVAALAAYVKSIGASAAYSPEAPGLFADYCAACHRLGGSGGDSGPDLSLTGTVRDIGFIRRYIADPLKANSASAMPGFSGQLTDVQIEDLARYLATKGRPSR